MTAVADFSVPGTPPEPAAPAFGLVDLSLLRLLDESDPDSLLMSCSEAELVDRIAQLESLQHRVAALQSAAIQVFARRHVASRIDSGAVEPGKLERSVAGQIGLACRVSPIEGGKRMRMARDLRNGHDRVLALFTAGEISAYKTLTITVATSGLDAAERAEVDRRLAAHDIAHMGVGRIRTLAQAADTLVERVTGQATAPDVAVEVQVVVPIEALLDPDSPLPAHIPGHGPVPLDVLATASGRKTLRRLLTRAGIVIGGDSRQRLFTGVLAEWIRARDGYRCSEPYCDAPIRHLDHIQRFADDGISEFDNGRGVCELHNHLRETPGWAVQRTAGGVRTTTPTGHTYIAPPWRLVGSGSPAP